MKHLDFSQQVIWTDFHGKDFICIMMQQILFFLIMGREFPTDFGRGQKHRKGPVLLVDQLNVRFPCM